MGNSIYLGGGIKSAFCGGNVKEIWQGFNKLWGSGIIYGNLTIGDITYKTVKIGNQEWTAEFLKNRFDGITYNNSQVPGQGRGTYAYPLVRDQESSGAFMFQYDCFKIIESFLIDGWKVPTMEDLRTLVQNAGSTNEEAAVNLASKNYSFKNSSGQIVGFDGADKFGFNAVQYGGKGASSTWASECSLPSKDISSGRQLYLTINSSSSHPGIYEDNGAMNGARAIRLCRYI